MILGSIGDISLDTPKNNRGNSIFKANHTLHLPLDLQFQCSIDSCLASTDRGFQEQIIFNQNSKTKTFSTSLNREK